MLSPHRNTINGGNGDDDDEDEAARWTSDLQKKSSIKMMLGFSELFQSEHDLKAGRTEDNE